MLTELGPSILSLPAFDGLRSEPVTITFTPAVVPPTKRINNKIDPATIRPL